MKQNKERPDEARKQKEEEQMASWCRTKVLGYWIDEAAAELGGHHRTMPKGMG